MTTDRELLHQFVACRNRDAFTQLVERYLPLVNSAARRQVGDAPLAHDVAQAVFMILWQRAARIRDGSTLPGWLITTTRLAARQALRTELRLRRREQIVAAQRFYHLSKKAPPMNEPDIAPLLDDALTQLNAAERTAVTLRYLQDKSLAEVAVATGISEAAAAKRISRGLERLRQKFSRRGHILSGALLVAALQKHAHASAPSLATAPQIAVHAALGSHAAGAAIAKSVLVALTVQRIATFAAAAMVVLLVSAGTIVTWHALSRPIGTSSPVSPIAATLPQASTAAAPIKVGVVISVRTAKADSPMNRPWGYQVQNRIAVDLQSPDVELYPVIEPGTEKEDKIPEQVELYFAGRAPISDAESLKKLDVIVANEVWVTSDEFLSNLEAAISSGVGFLNNGGIGSAAPGLLANDERASRLAGLASAREGWSAQPVECTTLVNHPILGPLWGLSPADLKLRPNGAYGQLPKDATPLIRVAHESDGRGNADSQYVFCPLYISSLGKGTIIGVQFSPYKGVPEQLQGAGRPDFFLRCIRFLAHRPVESP